MSDARRYGLAGVVILVLGALVAGDRVVPGEVGLTELVNDLPGAVIDGLELFMQLGARPAILLVAVVAAVIVDRRRWRVALAVLLAGGLAWVGSHLIAEMVERPRPASVGAEVVVRDDAEGFAYPSAHVSIATASLSAAALGARRSPAGAVGAGTVVGAGRLAVGVHLPLDVLGGLGLGVAAAVFVVDVVDRA